MWTRGAAAIVLLVFLMPMRALSQQANPPAPVDAQPDRLGEALALVGFARQDLGYAPKGYWSRYPNPSQMMYALPFFGDLFAEPMRIIDFAYTMAMATDDYLAPAGLAGQPKALYQLVYFLGIDRKLTQFRAYGANLNPALDAETPLVSAIQQVYARSRGDLVSMTFGGRQAEGFERLQRLAEALDPALQKPLAALVLNVLDAYQWRTQAFRHADRGDMSRVFRTRNFGQVLDDGRVYPVEIDDLSRDLDEPSLYYACMKAVQAADDARRQFAALRAEQGERLREVHFDFLTPIGRIVLAGTGDDVHAYDDVAVLVDLGGNDRYTGPVGATASEDLPISIAIDCAGNDTYAYDSDAPAQGAGVLGVGVLVDDAGDDTYTARQYGQGLGVFGLGLLFDRDGNDRYDLQVSGQGAGYCGLGYQLDSTGDDRYYIFGDGQGYGGPGGVGVLANYSGDDRYVAEADAAKAGRPDYHSEGRISQNNAQGVGGGRRGDGSDGHSWGGGLGVLLDRHGDDAYEAGNFSMGLGYMYGTGLLFDGTGNDTYRSVYFTQGSGAHFCIGALIDGSGNDRHVLYDTGGAGLAFGWDLTTALLLDCEGNDYYEARGNSLGRADIRSNALFLDLAGDDQYVYPDKADGLGTSPFRAEYREPGYSYGPYSYYGNSLGLLLDIGGADRYLDSGGGPDKLVPSSLYGNDRVWQQPSVGSPDYGYRSFGVGMDVGSGTVPEAALLGRLKGESKP